MEQTKTLIDLIDLSCFSELVATKVTESYDSSSSIVSISSNNTHDRWILRNLAEIFSHLGFIVTFNPSKNFISVQ